MRKTTLLVSTLLFGVTLGWGQPAPIKEGTVNPARAFEVASLIPGVGLAKAPSYDRLYLKSWDRLAICGDSITEQKMYSRIIEDYLVMCAPELNVTVRQYGWGGERAPGFLARMTNDCLRFNPTVATTCYGMNDHEYRKYEERIGGTYYSNSVAIVQAFQAHGARVIHGSPGCVGKLPGWIKGAAQQSVSDLNANLATLRNIGLEVADETGARFADVYTPMLVAWSRGKSLYGAGYEIPGSDGVHPGWAGQAIMAYAFLSAMGLDGNIGTIVVDLNGEASASAGHEVVSAEPGKYVIRSWKYPFCFNIPAGQKEHSYPVAGKEDPGSHDSIRSVLSMVPFNEELNRLTLKVSGTQPGIYRVAWGDKVQFYTGSELKKGINLAADFVQNPFNESFSRVDAAVYAKQAYETHQIKKVFHSSEAKNDMEAAVIRTETEREPLAQAVREAFQPVVHSLEISRL